MQKLIERFGVMTREKLKLLKIFPATVVNNIQIDEFNYGSHLFSAKKNVLLITDHHGLFRICNEDGIGQRVNINFGDSLDEDLSYVYQFKGMYHVSLPSNRGTVSKSWNKSPDAKIHFSLTHSIDARVLREYLNESPERVEAIEFLEYTHD